jgi:hypothetical protein
MSESAFAGTAVAELTVPFSVEVIAVSYFFVCLSLEWVGFESGSQLRRIEANAFVSTPLTELELPNSVRSISGRAFNRELLKSISIHSCPTNFRFSDGMLEEASWRMLVFYFGSAASIVIGRSIEMIGDGCFRVHETLTNVAFESDSVLERIEELAFAHGKLTGGIVLPRTVRVLARDCFYGCKLFTSVTFESDSALLKIGESAFESSGLRSIVIPASVRDYDWHICLRLVLVTRFSEVRRGVQLARDWGCGICGLSLRGRSQYSSPASGRRREKRKVNDCSSQRLIERMSSNSKGHPTIQARTKYSSSATNARLSDRRNHSIQLFIDHRKIIQSERLSSTIFAFPCTARTKMGLFASETVRFFFLLLLVLHPNRLEIASSKDDQPLFSYLAFI